MVFITIYDIIVFMLSIYIYIDLFIHIYIYFYINKQCAMNKLIMIIMNDHRGGAPGQAQLSGAQGTRYKARGAAEGAGNTRPSFVGFTVVTWASP